MASKKISDTLQEAVLGMSVKEKDKLLMRLIRKDDLLIEQLHFQLLEDEFDLEQRRKAIRQAIEKYAQAGYSWTPGLLMMEMRDFSGRITRHVRVTKDKLGEVVLYLVLIGEYMHENKHMLQAEAYRADKFAKYVVKRAATVFKKAEKLHEDLHIEFEEELELAWNELQAYQPTARVLLEENIVKPLQE